jgi:hypothetical protein
MKALVASLLLPCISLFAQTTILPLGDSITAGGKTFTVYRQALVPVLTKRGFDVRFVGPNKDKTSAHAGYGGRNTAALLKMIDKIYEQHPADIVLLHSGHNNR